jgi:hypothetical protein
MLPKTNAFLRAMPKIWDDGYFAFGSAPNTVGSTEKDAVLSFFGEGITLPALSGHGEHEVTITSEALREIDLEAARHGLVQLLKNDLRMFSARVVDSLVLEELANVFFNEMGESRVYSNTVVYLYDDERGCLGPWSSVTKHSMDTFICAVNEECISYWLYGDDE